MKNFGIIYKITNCFNGKIYVGQTVRSLNERWSDHKRDALNGVDYPFHFAIRKYGAENFILKIIDFADSIKELNEKESLWIKTLNSLSKNNKGYNILEGGLALSNINAEPTINLTTNKEFASAKEMAKYYHFSYDFTLKLLNGHKRQKNGEIFRYKDLKKQKQAEIRMSFVPFHKALPKNIICLNTNEFFTSITDASKKLGINRASISNHLTGRSKSAGGFCFKYKESQSINRAEK